MCPILAGRQYCLHQLAGGDCCFSSGGWWHYAGASGGAALVLAAATADGDIAEGPAFGPVTAAGLAEVARLSEVVVVVVTKFGVGGIAARAS